MTNVGGTLLFAANDGVSGYELWKSDGTAAGTVQVADINVGPSGASPASLTNVNGRLFFSANDAVHGELWYIDPQGGTPGIPGDYDDDGRVDGTDFLTWQRSFGSATMPAGASADGDANGIVNKKVI